MIVVGVGCGPGMLTVEAIREIGKARRVYGSRRSIELAREYIPPGCEVVEVMDYSRLGELPDDAVVLSTGDPMLTGLGRYGSRVVPGISSMQVAFARLRLPLDKASIVDAHGRPREMAISETIGELERGKIVFIVADPAFDVKCLARNIRQRGLDCMIAVCEELGYESERIEAGTATSPPEAKSRLFSVVVWREAGR
ncbi:cobalt-precorrin-7 (C(5))-methyltransferase [Methanocella conradii]|uniref:cobalt-precorrin-7 (C(5))-methyltransferase n=1 Tax=Methanocella conradii TaxID=1175444 RepID=UPI0024B32993|nr:cobalt-precorrin-7 (C(5))-methyltransferase [Methanocella conradii]MDI6896258.1 cobalt-precorrin-7 (C(5))-methyltransferase [Methanocella conradii]